LEEGPLPEEISSNCIKAAVDFVTVSCQQTAFIAGKGVIQDEVDKFNGGGRFKD
jgi:hypothetical protein